VLLSAVGSSSVVLLATLEGLLELSCGSSVEAALFFTFAAANRASISFNCSWLTEVAGLLFSAAFAAVFLVITIDVSKEDGLIAVFKRV